MIIIQAAGAAADGPADDDEGGGVADPGRIRLKKAPNAFRTISEVADELHIPQHVLRFWETKFPQVKPLKRGGGRRYYRPDDISLLRRISDLLYIQGYTIKGVQRLLREGGGRLSDDIPPATPAERAAAEAERDIVPVDEGAVPEGLGDEGLGDEWPGDEAAADERAGGQLPVPGIGPAPAPSRLTRPRDGEAERLRAVLVQTLTELEALRALLP